MAPMNTRTNEDQELFKTLKESCVPLLSNAALTPSSVPIVSSLLSDILEVLHGVQASGRTLKPSIIAYVFFPVSNILRRNPGSSIPDQLLEKLLAVLTILCEHWWWEMDVKIWEQIFMLTGAILGGIESRGKGKDRADETKDAAAQCLWALLHKRVGEEDPSGPSGSSLRASVIFSTFQAHSRTATFVPVIGQTVDSLLATAASQHLPLVRTSLKVLHVVVEKYLSDDFVPTIFPGVVSAMCKIALAVENSKTWANGDVVASALEVLQVIVPRVIGDNICINAGIVRNVNDLEDLVELETVQNEPEEKPKGAPYSTPRTTSWLRGTSSQLHIALISLRPLVSHPTSSALLALSSFSAAVLEATPLTLPQSQPLLLTYLLSLTHADYDTVSAHARHALLGLHSSSSNSKHTLVELLLQIARDHLASLPRLLSSQSDAKVEHTTKILEAICALSSPADGSTHSLHAVSIEIGRLLGPNGGVERWGWSLLSILSFTISQITTQAASSSHLMLESSSSAVQNIPFPDLSLSPLTSPAAQAALERMLCAMGHASGEDGLYAVEWFVGIGKARRDTRAVAALWCASKLLAGVSVASLASYSLVSPITATRRKKLEKFVRGIAQSMPELWEDEEAELPSTPSHPSKDTVPETSEDVLVEHIKGLITIRSPLALDSSSGRFTDRSSKPKLQLSLRKALALRLIAVCAGVLQARFTPLLIHVLYPVLRSLVSDSIHLSSTALSALHYITHSMSYASPANLLLSNFDYALDSVSRRLSRRWLDVDAPKVLVILIRIVGHDIVQKAGDLVEECFDRLDEFHGYETLVDGLVSVLLEVVLVVGSDERNHTEPKRAEPSVHNRETDQKQFDSFFEWFSRRNDTPAETTDRVPFADVPHEAWGKTDEEEEHPGKAESPSNHPPPTPTQALTKQIVSRSMYFLTHGSALIRSRILNVLTSAVPVLPETALLPSIHHAWPFILNRLGDMEPFVVAAATALVQALADHVGDFMYKRVWDDIWPRFQTMLRKLDSADASSALTRRGSGAVGTESAYTVSHRLYRAMIGTMTAAARGVQTEDTKTWEVIIAFRRFLHDQAHEELQAHARQLYKALAANNQDAVWLALSATEGLIESWTFLYNPRWRIAGNVQQIIHGV